MRVFKQSFSINYREHRKQDFIASRMRLAIRKFKINGTIMDDRINISNLSVIAFLVLTSLIIAGLILKLGPMTIALCIGFTIVALCYNSPKILLMMLVFLYPFSGTELLKDNLLPFHGFKPLQLFALFAMIIAFFNLPKSVRLPNRATVFFGIVIAVFAFSIAHSFFSLEEINSFIPDPLTPGRYFLSKFIKPLIYFLPALVMIKFVYKKDDFDKLSKAISWSIIIFSLLIIYFFIRQGGPSNSINDMRSFLWLSLGTHTNNLANYFIMGFPFALSQFFNDKSIINYIKIALILVGVTLLFSRSAYFLIIISFFFYSLFSKRLKVFPIIVGLLFLAVIFVIPQSVIQRATKGFETKDEDVILAGRLEGLWLPLINEYKSNPKAIIFGNGRYAIISTKVHKMGVTIQSMHPHNMYLEALLDSGLIGLSIFIGLFVYLLHKCILYLRYLTNDQHVKEHLVAVITSLMSFLLSGFTDRTFFPDDINGYLWIIVALAFILFRYVESGETITTKASVFQKRLVNPQSEPPSL